MDKILLDVPYHPKREKALKELKSYLEGEGYFMDFETRIPAEGEMGVQGGILIGLSTLLSGGIFAKFGEALVEWVKNHRTEITLKNAKGEELTITARLDKQELFEMVNNFFGEKYTNETLKV